MAVALLRLSMLEPSNWCVCHDKIRNSVQSAYVLVCNGGTDGMNIRRSLMKYECVHICKACVHVYL
jgi:hypothetical protein